ncbi:hypothetical protein EDD29_1481 [Actinocorallia herbida]|uniref:Uncharacterized protein n=1 Tax=Actinocorallia herbida TaxID=58109 RepID=A0A3N1CRN3_9ACTN|nr:hypothetical protein [Actinocorallia herbida]ROO83971.1 hypothetical protein EDD29_1481 [Actinocorallia herbida]
MIILSGLLVIGAIALLVAGIVVQDEAVVGLHGLQLMYISIAVSIVSFLCLAIGVFLRRKELFGTAPARAAAPKSRQPGRAARQAAARTVEEEPAEREEATPVAFPMPSGQVPEDAIVHVVPGRKRYHLDSCRQLAGRQTEELTYVEAQEEGFSPCTACLPDTALAARAIAGPADEDGASSGLDGEPSGATGSDAPRPGAEPFPTIADTRRTEFSAAPYADAPFGGDAPYGSDSPYGEISYTSDTSAYRGETSFGGADRFERPERPEPVDRWSTPVDPAPAPLPAPSLSPVEDTVTDWVPTPFPPSPLDKDFPIQDHPAESEPEPAEEGDGHWKRVVEPVAAEPVARTGQVKVIDEEPEPEPEEPSAPLPIVPAPAAEVAAEAGPLVSVPESRESDDALAVEAEEHDEAGDDVAESAAEGPLVRILSGTKRYHRPECALIEDIGEDDEDLESLPRGEAKDRGCTPCLVCQPDKEPAV